MDLFKNKEILDYLKKIAFAIENQNEDISKLKKDIDGLKRDIENYQKEKNVLDDSLYKLKTKLLKSFTDEMKANYNAISKAFVKKGEFNNHLHSIVQLLNNVFDKTREIKDLVKK